jgi:hypothetical protein
MSISDKAQAMIDELVAACIAFGRQVEPDWQTRIEKAQRELCEYIDELESESERFTAHSDIERQDDKSPNDTQPQTFVYGKESEE